MPSPPSVSAGEQEPETDKLLDCIVVGSGLAGLTTALTCLDRGGRVLLLEKESKLGGNSMKASSGINACPISEGTEDSASVVSKEEVDAFVQDTMRSAGTGANPELIETLVTNSAKALQWLRDRVDVDLLQRRTRLGGHSRERTHRPVKGAVGYTVMSGMQAALKPFQESGALTIATETTLTGLISSQDDGNSIVGVTASSRSNDEVLTWKAKSIVLATGGFAANRANDSYLAQYRPDLLQMPATFGDFSTGEGIEFSTAVGAGTCLMDKVQIHPTGFVDPADPTSPNKFLCAELMRGIGGILLNGKGQRFCDELGTRDYVVDKMLDDSNKKNGSDSIPTFYLLLGSEAAKQGAEHVGFYTWKKLLQPHKGVNALAKALEVPVETLTETLKSYQSAASEGKDSFGKTIFPNPILGDFLEEDFLVGTVTPVLHYCMGGITVDKDGHVLNQQNGTIISGLYAAGEVAGGTHGNNRLAGNSLLECLVFGSIIGSNVPLQSSVASDVQSSTTTKLSAT
eukprot:scaffold5064_cov121-Cylindrotheca_fusiformis.AAC.4